jgi:lipoprotein NlpD
MEKVSERGKGIGIKVSKETPVFSAAPGKVVYSGTGLRGYGKLLIVKHNEDFLSVYAHNSQLLTSEGQYIAQGQQIAISGGEGYSDVLHFEVRLKGKPVDPLKYLPKR